MHFCRQANDDFNGDDDDSAYSVKVLMTIISTAIAVGKTVISKNNEAECGRHKEVSEREGEVRR